MTENQIFYISSTLNKLIINEKTFTYCSICGLFHKLQKRPVYNSGPSYNTRSDYSEKLVGKWRVQLENSKVYTVGGTLLMNDENDFSKISTGYFTAFAANGGETVTVIGGAFNGQVTNYTYKLNGNVITDWEGDNEKTNDSPLDSKIVTLTDTDLTLEVTLVQKPFNEYANDPRLDANTTYKFVFTRKFKKEK